MSTSIPLPHEKLVAYRVSIELLGQVQAMNVNDVRLRDQLLRAARSVSLNIAEGAGRLSDGDKKRVYSIARGECCETAAAIEIAAACRDCDPNQAELARGTAGRVYALLTGLLRRYDFDTLAGTKSRPSPAIENANESVPEVESEHDN
jgi:four helix bundle protein